MKSDPLFSRNRHPNETIVKIGSEKIGSNKIALIAGPCSVESEEQLESAALFLKKQGVSVLRGSAFKPRTSPYSFQGLGDEGLRILGAVRKKTGLCINTEVMDVRDVPKAVEVSDMIQVGARNMQNYDLLRELGKIKKPVLLKNGLAATVDEFLNAAEYILQGGNENVVLCLRGIRTFETKTRFTFDPGLIPVLKKETHLPVMVDPSHAAGTRELVGPISKAAIAAGADGLLIEVHPDPQKARSDAEQQLDFVQFEQMISELKPVGKAIGRTL